MDSERGQASVEFVGILPAALLVVLVAGSCCSPGRRPGLPAMRLGWRRGRRRSGRIPIAPRVMRFLPI